MTNRELIEKLRDERTLRKDAWTQLFSTWTDDDRAFAAEEAQKVAVSRFGRDVWFRGIIEFTNICKNNCYYCCRPCLRPFQPFLQMRPTSSREEEPELQMPAVRASPCN